MRTSIAMRVFSIIAAVDVAVHALTRMAAVAAAGTRPLSSSPTGSPDSSFASQAPTQDTVTPSSQLASEGSVAMEGIKIVAVCLALLALAWRIWGILKNTEAWRNLPVLLGADPADEPDEGAAAHDSVPIDGDHTAGVELALGPAPTPPGTAGASAARTEMQLAIPNLNVSELSGGSGCLPGAIFIRECTWTSTSSSTSTRECHYFQPACTKSA